MANKNTGQLSPPKGKAIVSIPDANDLASRATIIAIIAEKVRLPGDTSRQAKDKVGHRLAYATKKGNLRRTANGRLLFGDVVGWARQIPEWREKLAGLPEHAPNIAKPEGTRVSARHVAGYAHYAASLNECEALLARAHQENADLAGRLRAVHEELARLRPLADKWQKLVEKNRESGGKKKGM